MEKMQPPHIGRAALSVAGLDRSIHFYKHVIGLTLLRREGETAALGAAGKELLLLREQPGARPFPRSTGLYHFALLVPTRQDLGLTLRHLIETNAPISGFADHAVSEAIYLTDPDGHGIEMYRDRPRGEWQYPDGRLKLTTEPFDFDGVLAEAQTASGAWNGLAAGTIVGHIHLRVSQIPATEQFYVNILGFDVMARYGSGASFLAANGYHHHLGTNTWAGVGLSPAPAEAARLLWYEIRLPGADSLETIRARLEAAGYPIRPGDQSLEVSDPSGIAVRLTY